MIDTFNTWLFGNAIFEACEVEPLIIDKPATPLRFRWGYNRGVEITQEGGKDKTLVINTNIMKSCDSEHVMTRGSIIRFNKGTNNEFSVFQFATKFKVYTNTERYNMSRVMVPAIDGITFNPGYQHSLGGGFCTGSMDGVYSDWRRQLGKDRGNILTLSNMLTSVNPRDTTWNSTRHLVRIGKLPDELEKYVVKDKKTSRECPQYEHNLNLSLYMDSFEYIDNPIKIFADYETTITNNKYYLGEKKC